jgi:hypothetical protein
VGDHLLVCSSCRTFFLDEPPTALCPNCRGRGVPPAGHQVEPSDLADLIKALAVTQAELSRLTVALREAQADPNGDPRVLDRRWTGGPLARFRPLLQLAPQDRAEWLAYLSLLLAAASLARDLTNWQVVSGATAPAPSPPWRLLNPLTSGTTPDAQSPTDLLGLNDTYVPPKRVRISSGERLRQIPFRPMPLRRTDPAKRWGLAFTFIPDAEAIIDVVILTKRHPYTRTGRLVPKPDLGYERVVIPIPGEQPALDQALTNFAGHVEIRHQGGDPLTFTCIPNRGEHMDLAVLDRLGHIVMEDPDHHIDIVLDGHLSSPT